MTQQLIIIGAGGHGRVCAEIAERCGFAVAGFCDPAMALGAMVNGVPVIASDDGALLADWPDDTHLFAALGSNALPARTARLGSSVRRVCESR